MPELLKNRIGEQAINKIAFVMIQVWPAFKAEEFINQSLDGLDNLELKQRVVYLIDVLAKHLPTDFRQTALLLQQIPDIWLQHKPNQNDSFAAWPLIDYVAVHGLQYPQIALPTLAKLTHLFTAEFAIRAFLQHHFDLTLVYMQQWATDAHDHVRRLASEGIRSRLPWGQRVAKLVAEPQWAISILEHLKDDTSEYVQRSVANNLNDISKDYPQHVIELARQWLKNSPTTQRQWIIKQGTRSLIKAGHQDVLGLLGYQTQVAIESIVFHMDKAELNMDESVTLHLSFELPQAQALVIDYALHLPRANGKYSQKVFKWKTANFEQGQQHLKTSFSFKKITTRRYYAGEHRFVVLINGQERASQSLNLTAVINALSIF